MPDVSHDGSPGPSVKKKPVENRLVLHRATENQRVLHQANDRQIALHQAFPRVPYAQVARTGSPQEPTLEGPSAFRYGVAKPPGYLRIAPEEREIEARRQVHDRYRAFHQKLESSILDEDCGKARNDLWEKIRRYQNNLAFAPHGTLFPQTCAVSLKHHHVYGSNNGAGYPYQINVDGKLVGCLFCMPSVFHPELLIVVSNHYDGLPRPPQPRPIGYEVKQLQAERELCLQMEIEAQQQVEHVAERRAAEYIGQCNKKQAMDNSSEKGKQRQISASDLPYSMRHGLPPSVTQSLEPYRPVTPYQYSRLALMAQEMEQSELASDGGSAQTHNGPAQTAQSDLQDTQTDPLQPMLPLTLYSKDKNGGQSNTVQAASAQTCGMTTQDTREQKNPVGLNVAQPSRLSSSKLNPDHPEFVPLSHRLLQPNIWSPQIAVDKTDPHQQAIRNAFENPVPRKMHQYIAPQKRETDLDHPLLLSKENNLVLHVPVPRRHIPADRVRHFEAGLEGFTPPQLQLPYGMAPPPPEEPEHAVLDARNQSTSLESTYGLNGAGHGVSFPPRNSQVPDQDPLTVRTPYNHQPILDAYQRTHGQDSFVAQQPIDGRDPFVIQQRSGVEDPIVVQKTFDGQESFSTQQAFSGQQPRSTQQSQMIPKLRQPKQAAPAPVRHRGLWLPHEHLDEIAALPNLNARMLTTSNEEGAYNQLIYGPPGRFPLSNVRSTSQHPNGPSTSHYHAGSSSTSGNAFVSGSSEESIAPWDHPGNTTSLSIFERRSASHGAQTVSSKNHHAKRKQRRTHRPNGISGNHQAMKIQASHGYEQLQQQFATRQCHIQSLQTQLARLQQQQERAERKFFEQQQLIAQKTNGTWSNLTTGQLVFIVKPPHIDQTQHNQGDYNPGQSSQALVSQGQLSQAQTEDDNDISRL